MAAGFVQKKDETALVANPTITFNSNVAAGSMLLVAVNVRVVAGLSDVTSVTDSQSNTWVNVVPAQAGTGCSVSLWAAYNVNAGATTITVNTDVTLLSLTGIDIGALEYSGVQATSALEAYASAASSASGSTSSVTNQDLIIGVNGDITGAGTPTDGKTSRVTVTTLTVDDTLVGSAGTQSAAFSAGTATLVAAFHRAPIALVRTASDTRLPIIDSAHQTTVDPRTLVTPNTLIMRLQGKPHISMSPTPAMLADIHPDVVFKVFDLYTKEYFGMLPLDGVTWSQKYNTAYGQLQGTLTLDPHNPIRPEAIRLRRMLVAEVNEWPMWVGLLDKLAWDSDTSVYQVLAHELWSWYDVWPITDDLAYVGIEQVVGIFGDLLNNWIAGQTGGDIGLTTNLVNSGILRDLVIVGANNWLFGNIVRGHGTTIFDGYQVRGPRVVYDDATQTPRLLVEAASPTIGARFDFNHPELTPTFKYLPTGGNVIKVTFESDATPGAGYVTKVVGTSILTGNPTPAPLTAVAVNAALESAGWPESIYVMPAVSDYKQAALQARVNAELNRRASIYGAPSVTVTLASIVQSRLMVGDDAVFVFQDDERWPTKVVYVYRVLEIQVDVDAETAALVLDPSSVGQLTDESITPLTGTTPNTAPTGVDTGGGPTTYYPPISSGPNIPVSSPTPLPPFSIVPVGAPFRNSATVSGIIPAGPFFVMPFTLTTRSVVIVSVFMVTGGALSLGTQVNIQDISNPVPFDTFIGPYTGIVPFYMLPIFNDNTLFNGFPGGNLFAGSYRIKLSVFGVGAPMTGTSFTIQIGLYGDGSLTLL